MDHLPIIRLNYGLDFPRSEGEHTLGPLRCSGASHEKDKKRTSWSCADHWRSGASPTGSYHVQRENGALDTLECDMSKLPDEAGFQTLISPLAVDHEIIINSSTVIDLAAYKGKRLMVKATDDRILAFQSARVGLTIDTALQFIKIRNAHDGTCVTRSSSNATLHPGVRHCDIAYETVYSTSNRVIVEISGADFKVSEGLSVKISKAVECPHSLGSDASQCARVVDAESCYCAVLIWRNWQQQNIYCKKNGFSLLSLESAQEEKAVLSAWPARGWFGWFWSSLNDRDKEGTYVWEGTGITLVSSGYTNWRRGQPNGETQDCVSVNSDGWGDWDCWNQQRGICEKHP